jgi:hypothetical protein
MTVYSLNDGRGQYEAISPELALVDPALAAAARADLPDPGALAPYDLARTVVPLGPIGRTPRSSVQALEGLERLETSKRVLAGVAAVTILGLLLFDVRVEVGQKQASAEPPAGVNVAPAVPAKPAPSTTPKRQTRSKPSERKFAWAPVAGATAYHVEFFRGQRRVFVHDTTRPDITVPARWTYEGSSRSFGPGEYRWYVWPVVSGLRQSRAAVQSTVTITPN